MALLQDVVVPRRPPAQLEAIVGTERYQRLVEVASRFRERRRGRVLWTVNSTAAGGGVAEMLQVLLGYVNDCEIRLRWLVIRGDEDFFTITKRLHNQIHGEVAGGPLNAEEGDHYLRVLAGNANDLLDRVRPGEVVILHDPQTAGLTNALIEAGASVVWRCHIGADRQNDATRGAWSFLRPHLERAQAFVFSRRQHVPSWVPGDRTWIIPPSIDPFASKNVDLDPDTVRSILSSIGVLDGPPARTPGRFARRDGRVGEVVRQASVVAERLPAADDPIVVQVSRWDRLKDMGGVMRGFVDHVAPRGNGVLMLVGPDVGGVSDDHDGAAVYSECGEQWRALPGHLRSRVLLVKLPLDDVDENAAMVNALQRHATVVSQKSLAEGFGLTVAEAMWKGRAVVGSAVGGIADQIAPGTGELLADPADLKAFGSLVRRLLDNPDEAERMGSSARAHTREHYLADVHLLRYVRLIEALEST